MVGNQMVKITSGPITAPEGAPWTTMDDGGRTLLPGLMDAHVHMRFNSLPQL
jgi:imidazolonepropionase-like amidohydrolase